MGNLESHIGTYDYIFLCGKAHQVIDQSVVASLLIKTKEGINNGVIIPLYNGLYSLEYLQHLLSRGLQHNIPSFLQSHFHNISPTQILYGQTAMGARFAGEINGTSGIVEHTGYGPLSICIPPMYTNDNVNQSSKPEVINQVHKYKELIDWLRTSSPDSGLGHRLIQVKGFEKYNSISTTETLRWTKVAMNSILNPIVALFGVNNGQFNTIYAANSKFRKVIEQLCMETVQAVQYKTHNELAWSGNELLQKVSQIASNTANNTNSMLVDLSSGNGTEIDFINGGIVETMKDIKKESVAHKHIIDAVHAREQLVVDESFYNNVKYIRSVISQK